MFWFIVIVVIALVVIPTATLLYYWGIALVYAQGIKMELHAKAKDLYKAHMDKRAASKDTTEV